MPDEIATEQPTKVAKPEPTPLEKLRAKFAGLETRISFESPHVQEKYSLLFDGLDEAALTAAAQEDGFIPKGK